ncbi:MAG TPA: GNAT family N-acetyltransferase [Bacteroidota bacterium]|nr:GNAT family N-acetyltransferase [Bacteroidota bacterium]
MTIRPLRREDREPIERLLRETDVFSEEEIGVAMELVGVYLDDPNQKDYELFSSVDDGGVLSGYVCLGPTPATQGTFDLYWIAVTPSEQARGVGTKLLGFVEGLLRSRGGRLLVAETSSTPKYDKTRAFYEKKGFAQNARIKDYYKPGDDLVIYGKIL